MLTEHEILEGCKDFDSRSQQLLYKKYVSSMRMTCLRYCRDKEEAKDVLQEGFMKIFTQISKFNSDGTIEGWMKRIMINTAISYYKNNKKYMHEQLQPLGVQESDDEISYSKYKEEEYEELSLFSEATFTHEELLEALNRLPESYKLVFNMYHVEEFTHSEIAQTLNFDERTSRTRLFRAKKMLQDDLQKIAARKIDF